MNAEAGKRYYDESHVGLKTSAERICVTSAHSSLAKQVAKCAVKTDTIWICPMQTSFQTPKLCPLTYVPCP